MTNEGPIPKKSLGQHWLKDTNSLMKIVAAAELMSSDNVLEIGPGLGQLTELLLPRSKKVIAVELDTSLVSHLRMLNADNLEIINQDILKFDLTTLPPGYKLVANIPYYLTSHLIRVLSDSTNPPILAVLLIQKEVAERINAKPGGESVLSLTTNFFWEVELKDLVPAKYFEPKPKVDSRIILFRRKKNVAVNNVDSRALFRLIRIGFSSKRKTLLNSLSAGLRKDRVETLDLLKSAMIDPNARAQTLSINQWHDLYLEYIKT